MTLAVAGIAWAAFDSIFFTGVSGTPALYNGEAPLSTGGLGNATIAAYPTGTTAFGTTTVGVLDLFYADGITALTTPDNVRFTMAYALKNGSATGTGTANNGDVLTLTSNGGPVTQWGPNVSLQAGASSFTSGAIMPITTTTSNLEAEIVAVKNTTTVNVTEITNTVGTFTDGSRVPNTTVEFLVRSNHGIVGYGNTNAAVYDASGSGWYPVRNSVTLAGGYLWDLNSITIKPLDASASNGIAARLRPNQTPRYNATAIVDFYGQPAEAVRIGDFVLTGTVVSNDATHTVRLQNVPALIEVSNVNVVDAGLTVTGAYMNFTGGVAVTNHGTITVSTATAATIVSDDLTLHNLYYDNGLRLFETAAAETTWHGLTVRRALDTQNRTVVYTFTGTPSSTVNTTLFYPGGEARYNGTYYNYLLGPITATVSGTGAHTLTASPGSLSPTVGTPMTAATVTVTSSTGYTNINSISTSNTAPGALTSIDWNGLTIARTGNSTLTVSGTPTTNTAQTFYIYDGSSVYATLTISPISTTAASLSASPATISGVVSRDLTTKSVAISSNPSGTVAASVSPTTWNGLTLSASGSSVTISGVPAATGKQTFTVNGTVNGASANATSFIIDIAGQSALTLTPSSVSGVAGTSLGQTLVSVGSSTGTGTVDVTGLTQSSSTTGKSITWNGLTISASGGTITVSGTPETSGSTDITVAGTVGGSTATSATLRISIAAAGTPQLQLDSSGTSAVVGTAMTAKTFNVTGSTSGTVVVNGVTGGTQTSVSKEFTWKGLTIKTDGTKVTVSGTPTETGAATFTVSGTVGGVAAQNATFTVTISSASSPTLFQSSSLWKANRTDYSYELWIPVTSAFVSAFDSNNDGRVTKGELQSVLADLDYPYASLLNSFFDMINDDGTANGTLYLKFNFNPASGHTADWYVNMILKGLDIVGTNGTTYGNTFSGVTLESIQRYYDSGGSSGCDAGFGAFALLALGAAAVLRKKD